jgi:MOSC domain-containing protein YiiM
MQTGAVVSVHTGKIASLGDSGRPSAFVKAARTGPVAVGILGLDGDEQADKRFHGGPDKAIYAYDAGSYDAWAAEFSALRFGPGSMGENLPLTGFAEDSVSIGDRHRIGSALLEVCQPRQPCWKLAAIFDEPQLVKAMFANGRCGWYYRVLEVGTITARDAVELDERGDAAWTIRRLAGFTVARHRPAADVAQVIALPRLADSLRDKARKWLAQG